MNNPKDANCLECEDVQTAVSTLDFAYTLKICGTNVVQIDTNSKYACTDKKYREITRNSDEIAPGKYNGKYKANE